MAIFDLFSKRQKKLRGDVPDVYLYDDVNSIFRVQVVHIVKDTFGIDGYGHHNVAQAFKLIHDVLCKEYGVFSLREHADSDFDAIYDYFLKAENHEEALDIVELSFKVINTFVREAPFRNTTQGKELTPDDAISELNARFKEHGIGYQFESNEIIRIDSQVLHSQVVKPVLQLLASEVRFKGANEEYLSAHSHFRHGRYKECLVDTLKAFESVMKAICQKQGWPYNQNDTSKKLIDICFRNNLIPSFLQSQYTGLRSLLESGVPTVRNKLGGHGQGTNSVTVSEPIAAYAIHLAATNIVFLVAMETDNFSPRRAQ